MTWSRVDAVDAVDFVDWVDRGRISVCDDRGIASSRAICRTPPLTSHPMSQNPSLPPWLTAEVLVGLLAVALAALLVLWLRLLWVKRELRLVRREVETEFEGWRQSNERAIRRDAVQRSQAVTMGKVAEHLIPYLPDFQYNPKDARFIGSPVDFLVFDGLDEGELRSIVFVEVKTGASTLSSRERSVREAVQRRRVEWELMRAAGLSGRGT